LIPKISIIIPVYNREHLIGETLDSILTQTFTNWECILVDDHSTDTTVAVLKTYAEKDTRFRCAIRPEDRPKGANACRNYGLELSKGSLIQWFDSDDIMLPDFLNSKFKAFEESTDCVISKCVDLHDSGNRTPIMQYENNTNCEFSFKNYLRGHFFCFTPDLMIKKHVIKNIRFNESLQSGQEYHFFLNLLAFNDLNAFFLDQVLTLRRVHPSSVQELQKKNQIKVAYSKYKSRITVLKDTSERIDSCDRKFLINELVLHAYVLKLNKKNVPYITDLSKYIKQEKGLLKAKAFDIAMYLAVNYKKGYKFMNYART
jgi:glycosyltransferase involved in cell wall biosynthesis